MTNKNDPTNEVFKAYIEFVTAVNKTSAEVYAKTWQDATKFNEIVVKNTTEMLKNIPSYQGVSNLWTENNPWGKK